jgi:chromosome segregation ATPase
MKKNDKKNDTNNNDLIVEIEKKFERHTNILMEQMKHEVKTVAEGHSILVKKLDKVESEIGEIKNDVQGLKQDMREVKSELGSVKMIVINISHEMNDHEKRIKKVEEKVLV